MKNTPRDFFLHFGAFAALYASATALTTLLFRIIDYALPDPLRGGYYYADPYSGPMRFAIASLIILVPIFLYLMRVLQREARSAPERYMLTVRRWLTHITLFAAGATIVGDLIALLYSFLGGTLATAFLLKVLALLGIVGAIFWYFLLDIRNYWQERERASKLFGRVVLALALIVIVSGFSIMGLPGAQREMRFDEQQVQDISAIQDELVSYWQGNRRLPQTLSELENEVVYFKIPTAPEGRAPYEYHITGDLAFELCATFARESDEYGALERLGGYSIVGETNWQHGAGRTCFERSIDPALIRPLPTLN